MDSQDKDLRSELESLRTQVRWLTQRVHALELSSSTPPVPPPMEEENAAPAPPVPEEAAPVPRRGEGWEAIVAGNWLNKIGVLVLVIGLVLFAGYSFTRMGPGGRVAISLAASAAMLGAGVLLERREQYRVIARGLIGGGWAGLYATTYAAHAVEQARIVADPTTATLLLAVVAIGMIVHSLRFRSQAVTGMAYSVAFITLAVSDLTFFAVIAQVPLAVSLLWLAHRFRWTGMALAAAPATYVVSAIHMMQSERGSLAAAQTVLAVYWLVFEVFDLLEARRTAQPAARPTTMFALNALCFTGASLPLWYAEAYAGMYQFFVLAAGMYAISTALRAVRGAYVGALTLAAVFAAAATTLHLGGASLYVGLLIEAELIFLLGLRTGNRYVSSLAMALFAFSTARMLALEATSIDRISAVGKSWHSWTPLALLHAILFWVNRAVSRDGKWYGYAATALVLLVLAFETPSEYGGLSWLLYAAVLYEGGKALRQSDIEAQALWAGAAGVALLLIRNTIGVGITSHRQEWAPQLLSAILLFAAACRLRSRERELAVASGAIMTATLLFGQVSGSLLTVAWGGLGVLLLVAGFPLAERSLRLSGLGLLLLCVLKLFVYDLSSLDLPYRILSFVVLGLILIGASLFYTRFRDKIAKRL